MINQAHDIPPAIQGFFVAREIFWKHFAPFYARQFPGDLTFAKTINDLEILALECTDTSSDLSSLQVRRRASNILTKYNRSDTDQFPEVYFACAKELLSDGPSPIDVTWKGIHKHVRERYVGASETPENMVPFVELRLQWSRRPIDKPTGILSGATAVTKFDNESLRSSAEITMTPFLNTRAESDSIPYLMMHELVCHSFQGPWDVDRAVAEVDTPFAEGWMDIVAWNLLEAMHSEDGDENNMLRWRAESNSRRRHLRRYEEPRSGRGVGDTGWAGRLIGAEAARDTLSVLRAVSPADGLEQFIASSLRINMSDMTHEDRDTLVANLWGRFALARRSASEREEIRRRASAGDPWTSWI